MGATNYDRATVEFGAQAIRDLNSGAVRIGEAYDPLTRLTFAQMRERIESLESELQASRGVAYETGQIALALCSEIKRLQAASE